MTWTLRINAGCRTRSGMRTRLGDSGDESAGASCWPSQAETAATSLSERRVAMRFMQSGSAARRSPTRQRVSCAAM
jgi:hypothetical protein